MGLHKRNKPARNSNETPEIEKRSRLFNGYIRTPLSIIFFPCLICISFLLLSLYAARECILYSVPPDLIEDTVIVLEIAEDNHAYVLTTDKGVLEIPATVLRDPETIIKAVSKQSPLIIRYELKNSNQLRLWNATDSNGNVIVSIEDVYHVGKQNTHQSAMIIYCVTIGFCSFTLLSYYLLSNAPRYPRLVALLVRKEFRNF